MRDPPPGGKEKFWVPAAGRRRLALINVWTVAEMPRPILGDLPNDRKLEDV